MPFLTAALHTTFLLMATLAVAATATFAATTEPLVCRARLVTLLPVALAIFVEPIVILAIAMSSVDDFSHSYFLPLSL